MTIHQTHIESAECKKQLSSDVTKARAKKVLDFCNSKPETKNKTPFQIKRLALAKKAAREAIEDIDSGIWDWATRLKLTMAEERLEDFKR